MKILIATDGSKFGDLAIKTACEWQWPESSELRVISVVERPMISYVYNGDLMLALERFNNETDQLFENIASDAAEILRKAGLTASFIVREGSVAEAIIDEAKEWDADLILLGTHGRKGLSRFFIGSVALRVATHAPCSVEIIRFKEKHHKNK